MPEDVPVKLKAVAAADGVNASLTIGAPINKTYTGVIAGSQVVVVIPAADVVLATVMDYTSSAAGSTSTRSGRFIIGEEAAQLEVSPIGAALTASSQVFTITPNESNYLYGIWVGSDADINNANADYFDSGSLSSSNSINATDLPTDGRAMYLRVAIDKQDGAGIDFQMFELTAHTSVSVGGSTLPDLGAANIIPGAEGYGISNTSPLSYADIRVADNVGELLANLGDDRVILCNFSDWHIVNSIVDFGHNNLYIPGQVAPGQGFGLSSGANSNNLSNIAGASGLVLEHFRLVPTSEGADGNVDAFRVDGAAAQDVYMRHMSMWAGRDQQLSIWSSSTDVVLDLCTAGPSTSSNSSRGPLVGAGSERVMLLRSLLGGNNHRNPLFQSDDLSVVNCVVGGFSGEGATYQDMGAGVSGNLIANTFREGSSSNPALYGGEILFFDKNGTNFNVYLSGNVSDRYTDPAGDQKLMCGKVADGGSYSQVSGSEPWFASSIVGAALNITAATAAVSEAQVYAQAGAMPNRRDSKVADIVARTQAGTMASDSSFLVADLPTLSGGPSRVDVSRGDFTSAAFRSQYSIPDGTDCLTATAPDGNRLFDHFLYWCGQQS